MEVASGLLFIEHCLVALVVAILVNLWFTEGAQETLARCIRALRTLGPVNSVLRRVLGNEVRNFTKQISSRNAGDGPPVRVALPTQGVPREDLLKELDAIHAGDEKPEEGRMFALVYTGDNDVFRVQTEAYDKFCESTGLTPEHDDVVRCFHHAFMHENALNPMMFPSLRRFENEVISMTASMLHGDGKVVGSLTSGGTESILMAMITYRHRAQILFPHIKNPEMVAPVTIHPAHEKAAHYFGFTVRHVPVNDHFLPDMLEYEQAITPSTIALLASAPQYCHGVVDPIPEIAALAERRGLPLHVDACFGGFMLPWVEKLGYDVPAFDFRLAGVTSISADVHKYGYGTKGASVVLYRDAELRRYQIFAYSQWPGGLFGSPSMAGTRPGGNIAAAWAALKTMGESGYLEMASRLMDLTTSLKQRIRDIQGLQILGEPHMTAFAIGSADPRLSILEVADALEQMGWKPERQQYPASLHCSITPLHLQPGVADELVASLDKAVTEVKNSDGKGGGSAAMYGMVASIPDKTIVDDFIIQFFSEIYS